MEYDKENISDSLVRRLRRITDDPEFQPELVRGAVQPLLVLCDSHLFTHAGYSVVEKLRH